MSTDDFSDDNDDALAAEADVLEKSISDRDDLKLENNDKTKKERGATFECKLGQENGMLKLVERAQTVGGATGFKKCESGFSLHYQKGDLFSCPNTDSLAHCVSKDLRMGKGIAVLFKQKFGGVSELHAQANRIGEVGILKRGGRYVYYLITKAKYNDRPTYQNLENTLRSMKYHCVKYDVKRLSMPCIGCGLDKLVWDKVENILRKVFGDTGITITVYSI